MRINSATNYSGQKHFPGEKDGSNGFGADVLFYAPRGPYAAAGGIGFRRYNGAAVFRDGCVVSVCRIIINAAWMR